VPNQVFWSQAKVKVHNVKKTQNEAFSHLCTRTKNEALLFSLKRLQRFMHKEN
jgi:hypothetical protein